MKATNFPGLNEKEIEELTKGCMPLLTDAVIHAYAKGLTEEQFMCICLCMWITYPLNEEKES